MATLYDRYGKLAWNTAFAVLQDTAQAEEAVQQVFLSIWRQPSGFSARNGSLASWLVISSRNRALDIRRRSTRQELLQNLIVTEPRNMGRTAEDPALLAKAANVAATFSPEQTQALSAAFFSGLSLAQLAESCNFTPDAVKATLSSAVTSLRKALEA
jgi:RNA polymerase sigma-70 factor, ECF subfamily